MNKIVGLLAAYVVAVVVSLPAFADGTKIGVVDLQKIMQTAPQMKIIQEKLEKEFKPRRDKLIAMEGELRDNMEKLKRDAAVLSQPQRKALEQKVMSAQQQFERDGQQYQQELSTAHNDAMEAFYDKIRSAIVNVAARDKYDVVLQKDAAPFSADKLDVTAKVMQEIK